MASVSSPRCFSALARPAASPLHPPRLRRPGGGGGAESRRRGVVSSPSSFPFRRSRPHRATGGARCGARMPNRSAPVGVVSDYDVLALDSMSGSGQSDNTSLFPEADSSWKTFNEVQKLLTKTNSKVIVDLMTPAPLLVRETTNLADAGRFITQFRLLLETKYHGLPVVDSFGKLVGIITRGNVVRAALQIKRAMTSVAAVDLRPPAESYMLHLIGRSSRGRVICNW